MSNVIDLQRETAISLKDAVQYVPRRQGRKIHYSTMFRWVTVGVRGRILPTVLVGGIRFTTVEALGRFINSPLRVETAALSDDDLSTINNALDAEGL